MGALAGGPLCSGWGPRQNRSTDPLFRIGKSCLAVTPGTGPEGTDGAPETEAQGGAAEPWMGRVEIGARGHCGRDWHLRGRQQTGRHHTPGRGVGRCQPRRARGLQLHQACRCGSGAQERPRPDRGRARVARVVRVASRAGGSGPSPRGREREATGRMEAGPWVSAGLAATVSRARGRSWDRACLPPAGGRLHLCGEAPRVTASYSQPRSFYGPGTEWWRLAHCAGSEM